MPNNIHKTAIISPEAKLGDNITVGPYSIIDGPVTIGDGTVIGAHATVEGNTIIGKNCQIFNSAVIGSRPQDKKHRSEDKVFLTVGDSNIFREFVTANPGTIEGGSKTVIGNGNLFMACSHVAHDCQIGNDNVIANYVGIAGHVIVEDKVVIGGLTGVHQFSRIGYMSITGGCSKINQDIPPFAMADGHPAKIRGINVVGLKRANFPTATTLTIRRAFKILFESGLARGNALAQVQEKMSEVPEVKRLIEFIQSSKRGIS
jgi:UDP-N-acetylglucosamine acyltransferase